MTTAPDYDALYRLAAAGSRGALYLGPLHGGPGYDEALLSGTVTLPAELKRGGGKKVYDLVSVTGATQLVSPKVVSILEGIDASGWRVDEVGAYAAIAPGLEGYGRLVVTGRAGAPDFSRSLRTVDSDGTAMLRGLAFADDAWDGSDFAVPASSTLIVVTERVRAALESGAVTDLELERLAEYERMDY